MIRRKKVDLSLEKQILTGMIISDRFLREVLPLYHPDLLEMPYGAIVAKWCTNHFNSYDKAPGVLVEDIFDTWAKSAPDKEQVKYIEAFLATLSEEYERGDKFNADYLIDKTVQYFEARSLKLLAEDINYCLDDNNLEEAKKCYTEYRKVERILNPGVDVFDDEDAWREAFDSSDEVLFTVPGKLGELLNPQLTRESLIGLMAVAKLGKSWNLDFLSMCAVKDRCNVAMFQAGDLSQGQSMIRKGIYIAQRSNKKKYCGELLIPVLDCKHNQQGTCDDKYKRKRTNRVSLLDSDGELRDYDDATASGYQPCTYCQNELKSPFRGAVWHTKRRPVRPLTWQEAFKAAQDYKRRVNAKRFKLSTHASKTLNVQKIEAILDSWERLEGFIPDVIVIDYPDIMAPERKGNKEVRDDSNETWMALSGLRQKRKCCVIVATQANGAAIKEKTVSREHYANDRRKYDHVTVMYGLSQTIEEKRKGITRWGILLAREDDWDAEHQVSVLGCLSIGRPYLDSF